MPWFVLGFVNSLDLVPQPDKAYIIRATTFLLGVALAAMGLETDVRKLQRKAGACRRPILAFHFRIQLLPDRIGLPMSGDRLQLALQAVFSAVVARLGVVGVIVGVAQHPAGQGAGVLAVLHQHFAVDDRRHDAGRRLLDAPAARREVVDHAFRQRAHGVGVEDHDICRHAGA
jgi:hypothetical protein